MHQDDKQIKEEYDLIRQAQKNPRAFGLIYEKYYKAIFVFVDKKVDDPETTADLVSQVFLKALINLPSYQFKGLPFSAFLYRIATNQVNAFFRDNSRKRVVALEEHHWQTLFAESDLDLADREMMIAELLAKLSEDDVQLIELRFFEELPFKEIAYILDITENNAKVKTYRAIDKLKKYMKDIKDINF